MKTMQQIVAETSASKQFKPRCSTLENEMQHNYQEFQRQYLENAYRLQTLQNQQLEQKIVRSED